jgi:hypothetical protein
MEAYKRKHPIFALCGLNCGLCPNYHAGGSWHCPGFGGPDFSELHPTCAVVTCNHKHDNVEFCFECSEYPCARYNKPGKLDSFITYRNVLTDFAVAKKDLKSYLKTLQQKQKILVELLAKYNDGRSKSLYCLAANLLPLAALREIMQHIKKTNRTKKTDLKEQAKEISELMKSKARELKIELVLRKG